MQGGKHGILLQETWRTRHIRRKSGKLMLGRKVFPEKERFSKNTEGRAVSAVWVTHLGLSFSYVDMQWNIREGNGTQTKPRFIKKIKKGHFLRERTQIR